MRAALKLSDGVVTLRRFRRGDRSRMAEICDNERVAACLRDAFPSPYSEQDAARYISATLRESPCMSFAIESGGEYVGNIGLVRQEDVYRLSAELGYLIGEPWWNRGIATRAVNLICEYGFGRLGLIRIYSGVFSFNTASQRVLEKCGFVREAVLRSAVIKNGQIYDEYRYARFIEPPSG